MSSRFSFLLTLCLVILQTNDTGARKILGVFPTVSKSHWAFCSSVVKVLGEAGHDVSFLRYSNKLKLQRMFFAQVTVISPFVLSNSTTTTYRTIHLAEQEAAMETWKEQLDINRMGMSPLCPC